MLQRSITAMARVGTSAGNLDLHLTSHHVMLDVNCGFYAIADAAKFVRGYHLPEAVSVQDECNDL
jgi:hypothetical protein